MDSVSAMTELECDFFCTDQDCGFCPTPLLNLLIGPVLGRDFYTASIGQGEQLQQQKTIFF